MKKQTGLVPAGMPTIPKRVQDRLIDKMMEMNDTKIIERVQQRNAHLEAITRLNKEIEELCSLNLGQ